MYTLLLPGSKKASDFSEALGSQHFFCCYFTSFFVERNAVDPNIAAPLVPQIRIISYNFSSKSASFKLSTLPPQDSATVPDVWLSPVLSGIDMPSGSRFQIAAAEWARSAGQFPMQTTALSIAPACIWSHSVSGRIQDKPVLTPPQKLHIGDFCFSRRRLFFVADGVAIVRHHLHHGDFLRLLRP